MRALPFVLLPLALVGGIGAGAWLARREARLAGAHAPGASTAADAAADAAQDPRTGADALPREGGATVVGRRPLQQVAAPAAGLAQGDRAALARAGELARQNDMGIRALQAGDFERAVACFELCVKGAPEEPVFRHNLAEALTRRALARRERERPCSACLADLERALELDPDRADLRELAARWRAEGDVESGFWRDRSLHFELSYDGGRDDILHAAHRVLEVLEEAYGDLALQFDREPAAPGKPRIPVVLYEREGFDRVTGLGEWAGGAYDGTVRVPVASLAREEASLRKVLRHELAHAFIDASGGRGVPGWLNEGLAQWLEPERPAALAAARARLAGHALRPLSELSGALSGAGDASDIERAYSQSLLLVDHLVRHYGERMVFQLIARTRTGSDVDATFRESARVSLDVALADLGDELAR